MNNSDNIEKARVTYPVGHVKDMGGRKYIKTVTGWKYYGKGTGTTAQSHKTGSKATTTPAANTVVVPKFTATQTHHINVGQIISYHGKEYYVSRRTNRSRGRTNFHSTELASGRQIKLMLVAADDNQVRNPSEAETKKFAKQEDKQSTGHSASVTEGLRRILNNHEVSGMSSLKILYDDANNSVSVQSSRRRELLRVPNIESYDDMRKISNAVHAAGYGVRHGYVR